MNKNSPIASFLLDPQRALLMPKFGFVELFKHKEKICKISKHSHDEILELLYELIRHIDFYDENMISVDALQKSWLLVKDIDPKDMLFVALTIEMDGLHGQVTPNCGQVLRQRDLAHFLKKCYPLNKTK